MQDRTNYNVARVNKLLSRTTTLDLTLSTVGYTLHLLHALLSRVNTARVALAAASIAQKVSENQALLPGEALLIQPSPLSRLVRSQQASAALAGLIDDYRMFMRLVRGLPGIWSWGAGVWASPPEDLALRAIAWSQVASCALFQGLENWAYLGMKGVVAVPKESIGRMFRWSSRFWCAHVTLEFVRLARTRVLRRRKGLKSGGEEKENKIERVKEEAKWWEDVYVNAAWMPLTVHWSGEGFVGEGAIALLTLFAGNYSLRRAWESTA